MHFATFAFMFALLSSSALAEKNRDLTEDYLGIALRSTIQQAKQRIPFKCHEASQQNGKMETDCFFKGGRPQNKKYNLLNETKEIVLTFVDGRLNTIFVANGDSSGLSDALSAYQYVYGQPVVSNTEDLFKVITYSWENTKVIHKLIRMTGKNIKGNLVDEYYSELQLKN